MEGSIAHRAETAGREPGCGPLIAPLSEPQRSLRRQIFERVRAVGAISRAQIAKELGVSPATVTTQTSELIDAGLLVEVDAPRTPDDTQRGRPPVALGVRPDAHLVLGIKLSDRAHAAVIMDFAGNELGSASSPAAGVVSPAEMVAAADALVDAACADAGIPRTRLSYGGIGLPGFIDCGTGHVHWSPILDTRHVDFADLAAARLGFPVAIENDANLATLNELWFGAGRSLADFAVVTIEYGVGMGLVVNHHLYRGAGNLGMELGHTKVQLDGALCRCGQRGCLEAYIADYALAREATVALGRIDKPVLPIPVLLESLFDHAKAGNAAARAIFHRAGRFLALGLGNIVTLFDPPLIILSGERLRYDYLYSQEALAEMSRFAHDTGRDETRIEARAWGDLLWARGGAALALDAVTTRELGPAREDA